MCKEKINLFLMMGIIISFTLCGCTRGAVTIGASNAVWTEHDAEAYYEDLKQKMVDMDSWASIRVKCGYTFTYPEMRAILETQGIKHPVGFREVFPELNDEDLKRYVEEFIKKGYMRRDEDGNIELIGSFRRAILPMIDPYVYVEVTSEKLLPRIYYFHDTYMTVVDYYFEGDGPVPDSENPYLVNLETVENPGVTCYPWDIGFDNYKYTIVNSKTREGKEYCFDVGENREQMIKEIGSILSDTRNQSESIDREKHPKIIYECIRDLMEVMDTDVKDAKLLYEDCCWGTGTDVESIESYDADTRTLLVKGMDRLEYECRLDEDGDVNEVYEKGGERVFHDDSKTERPGKRKKSLVDLSILKN